MAPMTNRWVQLVASLVGMVMIANLQYAWTLFVEPMHAAQGWKLSDIQTAFTLFLVFETWVMPIEGWLIDRMGPRFFLTIASVLCGVGWTALGFVSTLWQLYLFYSITGVGAAFVYSGSIATALKWFPDKRGLASGLIAAGFGSGSALFIPLIANVIRQQDYRAAFLYTGIPVRISTRRRRRQKSRASTSAAILCSSPASRCCARPIFTCCT